MSINFEESRFIYRFLLNHHNKNRPRMRSVFVAPIAGLVQNRKMVRAEAVVGSVCLRLQAIICHNQFRIAYQVPKSLT